MLQGWVYRLDQVQVSKGLQANVRVRKFHKGRCRLHHAYKVITA